MHSRLLGTRSIVWHGALVLLVAQASGRARAAQPNPTLTARQIYDTAELTGGDLVLFEPQDPAHLRGKGPLAAFTPVTAADQLRVAISVPSDDYYNVVVDQVCTPRSTGYLLWVDDFRIPNPVWLRWQTLQLRRRHWAQVRLRPGRHVLRFQKAVGDAGASLVHPLAMAAVTLEPGASRSFFVEAETLAVVDHDPEAFRPRLGRSTLSGYAELVFSARRPGDAIVVALPPAPERATHLVAALVPGPDRGVAGLELEGVSPAHRLDTFAPAPTGAAVLATFPLDPAHDAPRRLKLACVGPAGRPGRHTLGLDGVAFGVEHTVEAEWLAWTGPWSPNAIPYSTRSGRVSDRGYVGARCQDTAKALVATLDLPWTGPFDLELRMCRAPNQGKVQCQFDGRLFPQRVDTYGKRHRWPDGWTTLGQVQLRPGAHTLRIWSREPDPSRRSVRIDAIRLVPRQR